MPSVCVLNRLSVHGYIIEVYTSMVIRDLMALVYILLQLLEFSLIVIITIIIIPDLFYVDRPGSCVWLKPELIEASPRLALSNFDQRFSGEKPLDFFSLDEYFAPAATWDSTRDLLLSVEFRVVPTLLLVRPPRLMYGASRQTVLPVRAATVLYEEKGDCRGLIFR